MRKTLALLTGLLTLVAGCDHNADLETFEVETNVLVTLTRPDGSTIPDMVSEIEQKWGFRAQTMNFIMPELTIDLLSSFDADTLAEIESEIIVTNWNTVVTEVVNDAQAIPFKLRITGSMTQTCNGDCGIESHPDIYVKHFAMQAEAGLKENMSLRILGTDTNGNSKVHSLMPGKVEVNCVRDESYYDLPESVYCSGKAEFHVQ